MNRPTRLAIVAAALLVAAGAVAAQQKAAPARPATEAALPAWERLSDAQRELLVAPLRERWNASPADRARMLERATRWRAMTPGQRARARRGMGHWEHMDPERRQQRRALFGKMRTMTPDQRKALRDRWHAMTAEQRRAWVEANPPADPR
jgi:hypothetical protein